MGVYGSLHKEELLGITMDDIKQQGSLYQVTINNRTKPGVKKTFVTHESASPLIEKYMKMRPQKMKRFFVSFRNRQCISQVK